MTKNNEKTLDNLYYLADNLNGAIHHLNCLGDYWDDDLDTGAYYLEKKFIETLLKIKKLGGDTNAYCNFELEEE